MNYWDLQSYKNKNSWSGDEDGAILWLLTPEEFEKIDDSTILFSIMGEVKIKYNEVFDLDTRGGYMAWGIKEYLV